MLLLAGRLAVRARSAYTLRLARGLPDRGFDPVPVCVDASQVSWDVRDRLDLRVYRDLDRPVWGRVVREGLLHDLRADPPDLIHVQSPDMLGCGTYLARRLGRPAVVTFPAAPMGLDRFARLDVRVVRVIAISNSVAADLVGVSRVPGKRVRVIHSGVDADDNAFVPHPDRADDDSDPPNGDEPPSAGPVRAAAPPPVEADAGPVLPPGRRPVVGTAGPLEVPKGLPYFLGAAARVRRRFPEAKFLLSGAGPEEANLRRLARELDLTDAVTFAPNLLDFSASLAATDVFCLPSLEQGLGATMLEAMARGRPVVASGVGGVDSVVEDGVTGLIVPPADSAALAGRVCDLLADPAEARRIGEAGRDVVRARFGVGRMVSETADLYRTVLAEWGGEDFEDDPDPEEPDPGEPNPGEPDGEEPDDGDRGRLVAVG